MASEQAGATEALDSLTAVVASVLEIDPNEVVDDASPATLGSWTSMKHIQLVVALEETYGLTFTHQEIVGLRSIKDVRETLRVKGAPA